jgi:hypothetical protein
MELIIERDAEKSVGMGLWDLVKIEMTGTVTPPPEIKKPAKKEADSGE